MPETLKQQIMDPEMTRKIDAILDRVKDPESGLSVARLGLVERVRYNEQKQDIYIFTDFQSHHPGCVTCAGIAMILISTIMRNLEEEFRKEFPHLTIQFV